MHLPKYASVPLVDRMVLGLRVVVQLPLLLTTALLSSPLVWFNKHKTWRRVLGDRAFRFLASLSVPQIQLMLGRTIENYKTVTKKLGLESLIEDIEHDARLLWLGPKRTDRVLLVMHGGAFFAPLDPAAVEFWRYLQVQLHTQHGVDLGVVFLNYSLIPEAGFPTPLRQAVAAIKHLMAQGVRPENMILAGDSAGGNLILQTLLHVLRPVGSVDTLNFPKPLSGAYLISPWVSLTGNTGSHGKFTESDVLSQEGLKEWGGYVLAAVPESQRGYVEAVKAHEDWFEGLDGVVDRILVTAGGQECLRDDIVEFHDKLQKRYNGDLKLAVQNGGVHNDSILDFLAEESKLGELTAIAIQWLAAGLS